MDVTGRKILRQCPTAIIAGVKHSSARSQCTGWVPFTRDRDCGATVIAFVDRLGYETLIRKSWPMNSHIFLIAVGCRIGALGLRHLDSNRRAGQAPLSGGVSHSTVWVGCLFRDST